MSGHVARQGGWGMAQHVEERLTADRPKRMLALDGGGVCGMITIGFLEHIEALLRARYGRNDLVLSDCCDMIGGTSAGSIIATMLALGWPMEKVRRKFWEAAYDIFLPYTNPLGSIRPEFLRSPPSETLGRDFRRSAF
jgi:patatin-like phospholipase/acyl hydrolase